MGSLSLLQGIFPNPGIKLRSPTLQADSLPAEPQGKPKNTGVGSLSLLQGIFPNPGIELGSTALQVDSLSIPGLGRSAGERIGYPLQYSWASLVAQLVKNLPAMQETWF